MSHQFSTTVVAAFLVIMLFISVGQCCSQEADAPSPIGLYRRVWTLVKDSYFDPACNEQSWARWEHRYDKQLKTMEDARKAIDTMLASLGDRYTRYLDPGAFEGEREQIAAKLCGIGIQMGLDRSGRLIVIAPIEGSPAAGAGLLPKDEIIAIDGKPTKGLSVEQASKAIRGPIGTTVVLTLIRDKKEIACSIVRDEIAIRSVHEVTMLDNKIGYVRLGTFMSERANEEMKEALVKLTPARGLIIDLRNNPGGLVSNALDICSMFLDGGIVVSTIDREGKIQSARANGHPICSQAVVILINEGSASASEITSGALRDSRRAELVGEKSFGKGLVQSITRLGDGGGLNMTIARYLTPNNTDINKVGIIPDHVVELSKDDYSKGRGPWFLYGPDENGIARSPSDGKDLQLSKALSVLNSKLELSSAPTFEIKLNPFPGANPFPNSPTNALH